MSTIPAIYEHGVFRPMVPVQFAEGTKVVIETEAAVKERVDAARRRTHEILSRSYQNDEL